MITQLTPLNAPAPRRRKLLRWSVGLLLTYALVGFVIAPVIVRRVAVKQLSQSLGREVSIEQVRLNPFALSGSIRGFLIKDLDGEPFVSWDAAYVNFQLSSFFGRPWVFKAITTTNPYVRVQINADYTLNFSDILARFRTNAAPATTPAPPLALRVGKLRIDGARASFTDRTLRQPFQRVIGPVQLNLENFQTDPSSRNPYSFAGRTDAGETFAWSGHFFLDPIRSGGELKVGKISLPRFSPIYQDLVRFELRDGVVDLAATYQFVRSATTNVMRVTNATFRLHSLQVAAPGATNNVVELGELAVTGASADAVARRLAVDSVFADGAQLWVRRDSNAAINFIELAQPAAAAPNAPGSVLLLIQAVTNAFAQLFATTNLWAATVHAADATNCAVIVEDTSRARPVHLRLDEISLHARHLSNLPGSNVTAQLSLRWNTNGTFKTDLEASLSPLTADVRMELNQLELQSLDPYLSGFVDIFILGSRLSVDGTARLRNGAGGLPQVTFNGNARLDDFSTVDGVLTNDLLKWDSVRVSGIAAQLDPPAVAIELIEALGVTARLAVETNQAINVLAALRMQTTNAPAAPATPPDTGKAAPKASLASLKQQFFGALADSATSTNLTASESPPQVSVNAIVISNAAVHFTDRSLPALVRVSIHDVQGRLSGLSTEDLRRGEIMLAGKIDRAGHFKLQGTLNPLNQSAPTHLELSLTDVSLSPASPYAGKFLGYQLNRGTLGVEVKYDLADRKLKGANVIVLDQLTLGNKVNSPDAVKLPIKLGLALLTDRNGRIELDVPVAGDLNDPEFRLRKVIWQVIGNIITKAVTSPFAALGSLLGGHGEEMSYVDFAPGRSELSTNATVKLDALAQALYERPGLELDLDGGFAPGDDLDALRRAKLVKRFRELKWQSLRKSAQAQTPLAQVALTADEYAQSVRAAYASGAATATLKTNQAVAAESLATRAPTKGAQSHVKNALVSEGGITLAQMERQLLDGLAVEPVELQALATARAARVQEYLGQKGNVERSRMFLVADDAASTNRLARVQLRLK